LPYIFGGMKISITLAIIGVIVSEFVASQEGIGYLIKLAGGLLDTPLMLAAIVALSISGLALYAIIAAAESWAVYWQPPPAAVGVGGGGCAGPCVCVSTESEPRRPHRGVTSMTLHRRSLLKLAGATAASAGLGIGAPAIVRAATPVKMTLPWLPLGTFSYAFVANK